MESYKTKVQDKVPFRPLGIVESVLENLGPESSNVFED